MRIAGAVVVLLAGAAGWLACGAAQHTGSEEEASSASTQAASPTPRSMMHGIFDGISELWPLMLDDEAYFSEAGRRRSRELIDGLADQGWQLEKHAQSRDVDFRLLARSLSADFREAQRLLGEDRQAEARFSVAAAIGNCVRCHSRLPKARDFPIAERLVSALPIEDMSPDERALYQVAVRAFEPAMQSWEQYFASANLETDDALLLLTVNQFLRTAIIVQREPERARATLVRLAGRNDVGQPTEGTLTAWADALDANGPAIRGPATLDEVRALAGAGDASPVSTRPVNDLVALGLLARILDEGVDESGRRIRGANERAEAYRWIGIIEARNDDPFWSTQAAFHLELAIRTSPGSAAASEALTALEQLPDVSAASLVPLRELIERANPRHDD